VINPREQRGERQKNGYDFKDREHRVLLVPLSGQIIRTGT
jgi:hypothetical protein